MTLITDSADLSALCDRLRREDFVTVDTEFIRDATYWPVLCLIQLGGDEEAHAVDALAEGIDLAPVRELLTDPEVLKVFHAARQDLEIFHNLWGVIPQPFFDTQIAGMVCGFGDQVSYEVLVNKLAKGSIDKSSRFTDWALRPLTEKQLRYALSDVTHLRQVYRKLASKLERTGREQWVREEIDLLTDPATYTIEPEEAWRRLKLRSRQPRFLAIVRELAAWRERKAQTRDIPRNRVIRDEAILEIAAHAPKSEADLGRTRALPKGLASGRTGAELLEAVEHGLAVPEDQCPVPPAARDLPRGIGPIVDLLKVLLKMKAEDHDVAQRLIATTPDLEDIAADDDADVAALKGWRREVFGEDALALKHGRLALTVRGKHLVAEPVGGATRAAE